MNISLNIMLLLSMALFYNMMAVMFGVEHWYFLGLAPLLISAIGFMALSGSNRSNRVSLALVPLLALPIMLPSYSLNEIVGFVFSHAVMMAVVLYPAYESLRKVFGRKGVAEIR
jgi:hypothetical protein